MDFPVTLDSTLDTPLWKQLFRALLEAISTGRLKVGEALPPIRALSETLGLSRDTVVRTYQELSNQGYIQGATRNGTIVLNSPCSSSSAADCPEDDYNSQSAGKADRLSFYAGRLLRVSVSGATAADLPALNYGAPPPDQLPLKLWKQMLLHQAGLHDPTRLSRDWETFGNRALREAIASYLRRAKAVKCTGDQVLVFPDSQQPLDLIARLLVNAGDGVIVENPGYSGAREIFSALGASVYPLPVDEQGLVVSGLNDLGEDCKLAYITAPHQDPTGVVLSEDRRRHLLAWAKRNGAVIVEDAFDSDFRYASPCLPALQSLDSSVPVVYMYSFWKILYPICSVSCIVLPKSLLEVFAKARLMVQRSVPAIDHLVLTEFLSDGHIERHIRKTRAIYARRRQSLIFALAQNFRTDVMYYKESAGLHLLVRFKLGLEDNIIEESAQRAALPMVSTRAFYVERPAPGEFLIPFASIPEEAVAEKLKQMARLVGLT